MNSLEKIEELSRRTRRYEFQDGLRDVQLGISMLLMGFIGWLAFQPLWFRLILSFKERAGKENTWLVSFLPFLLLVLILAVLQRLINVVRKRWLWRQSGYVKPLRTMLPRRVTLVAALIFIAGIAAGAVLQTLLHTDSILAWRFLWAAAGWSQLYALVALSRMLQLRRYLVVSILAGVLSTLLIFVPFSFALVPLAFGLIWGLLLIGSGSIILTQTARAGSAT